MNYNLNSSSLFYSVVDCRRFLPILGRSGGRGHHALLKNFVVLLPFSLDFVVAISTVYPVHESLFPVGFTQSTNWTPNVTHTQSAISWATLAPLDI